MTNSIMDIVSYIIATVRVDNKESIYNFYMRYQNEPVKYLCI